MSKAEVSDEAERIDLIRRRVLNVVGHELRTPFTTLRGLTDRLPDADSAELATLAPAITRLTARLDELLSDMLIASGVSTAEPVSEPIEVDLGAVVRAEWSTAGGDAAAVEGSADMTHARAGMVESILERVFDNAFRHGNSPRSVQLSGRTVMVRCGAHSLDPADVDQIFEFFYRGEHAVMNGPGLGLGLPIAREIARLEGGDVEAAGDGTDLVVTMRFGP